MKPVVDLPGGRLWSGFPKDLWNIDVNIYPTNETKRGSEAKYNTQMKEINNILKMSSLKNIKSIDFDFEMESRQRNKLSKEFPNIVSQIVDKIDFNDKWMVFYKYKDVWRSRKLDEITSEFFIRQASDDLDFKGYKANQTMGVNVVRYEAEEYDFMPISFRQVQTIRIVNVASFNHGDKITSSGNIKEVKRPNIEDDESWKDIQALKTTNPKMYKLAVLGWYADKGIKPPKRVNEMIGGSFWKWTLNLPINLERYMIFNELNQRTVKIMEEDNCLIYACKQYGLPQDIIDHMKEVIKCKYFRMTKLKQIAEETGVSFYVEEKGSRHHQYGPADNKYNVPLLLFENHYMLNERVKISPYYVRHIYEINADKNALKRPIENRQLIDRQKEMRGKKYYTVDQEDYPLRLILRTIFEVEGFTPIKMGDYLTYSSTLYKYKLNPLDTLEYNEKFCCRLKAPYDRRNVCC